MQPSGSSRTGGAKVSSYGMSDAIGPVYLKERPGSEMPTRIDVEVVKPLKDAYARMKFVLKKVFEIYMTLNTMA
ncbi:putative peptidase M41 [Helianthus anomalus]